MRTLIKKLIPAGLLARYHKLLAVLAGVICGHPSEKIIVIGVTGTNGKSTTVMLTAKILEEAGYRVGETSTAMFKIADREWLNNTKMTMLGRFALQKMLKKMVSVGCKYAVVETSSQGIEQFRHLGIHYDLAVFTNLTPEHIEAHGGFDNYKKAKLKLFKKLEREKIKIINKNEIKKVIIANADDDHAQDFLNFKVANKYVFGLKDQEDKEISATKRFLADNLKLSGDGTSFSVNEVDFNLKLFGRFNVYNSLAAIATAQSQTISLEICKKALEKVTELPGRMEFIEQGQDFRVLVDYAPEPESMRQLYQTIGDHNLRGNGRIIHVFGSCGGGRDVARRSILGDFVAQNADIAIITNEDPYDDDPQTIIDQIAQGTLSAGKVDGQNLFKIIDRREAIEKAFNLAKKGDLVVLTGKGCEQAICVAGGKKLPWDERVVARELLKNKSSRS
ncbi:MAG: UDP-N-acetylmuramyl-tripeptide synthetase [Patescibacteria group bacterium]